MRSLALLLLLANIVVLTWQLSLLPWIPWQPTQFIKAPPTPKPPKSNVPLLILLNETDVVATTAQITPTRKVTNSNVSKINTNSHLETPKAEVKGTEKTDIKSISETKDNQPALKTTENTEIKPQKTTTEANSHHTTKTTATQTELLTADRNAANAESSKPVRGNTSPSTPALTTTRTIASLPTPGVNVQVANDSAPNSAPPKPLPVVQSPPTALPNTNSKAVCFQAGPFSQAPEAKKVADWLNHQAAGNAVVQARETPVLTITKVYLPPLESRQAAQRVAQRLTQLGIKDYMVESNNAISLGMFRSQDSVTRRVEQLQAKGYHNVNTDKHYENNTKYWITVKMLSESSKPLLEALGKKFKGTALEPMACQ